MEHAAGEKNVGDLFCDPDEFGLTARGESARPVHPNVNDALDLAGAWRHDDDTVR